MYFKGVNINSNRNLCLHPPRGAFRVHKTLEAKVIVLKLVPGFDDEMIMALIQNSTTLKALVLEMCYIIASAL
jgi:L-asparaginase